MTGAPVEAYASRDFVIVNMRAVRDLGSWEAAGCFQRIAWRCERDGYWTATMQEIADEIGVSLRTAKRITQTLREKGWLESERRDAQKATLTWTIVWASESANLAPGSDEVESANLAPGSEGQPDTPESATVAPSEGASSALSSTETVETDETNGAADAPPADDLTEQERETGRDADGKPLTGKRLNALSQEVAVAWWEWAKAKDALPTQSFIACRQIVKTALGNGAHPKRVKSALARLTDEGRPVSGGSLQIALGGSAPARGPQHPSVPDEHKTRVAGSF